MTVLLSRSHLLTVKRPARIVYVPEWGVDVRLIQMDLHMRQRFFNLVHDADVKGKAYEADPKNVEKPLFGVGDEPIIGLLLSIVDEDDKPIFELTDGDILRSKGSATINQLYMELIALNTFGAIGDVLESEKKDSETTPNDSSSSA